MALYAACPDIKGHILDKNGKLHEGMQITVNSEIVFPWDPEKQINNGDQILISSIITGG